MNKYKYCNKCHKCKMFDKFSKHKLHSDGLQSICKICIRKSDKLYRDNNKDKIKKYRNSNPWFVTLSSILGRCNNKNHTRYKWYGGKGIKNFLKVKDLKYLWFRDKAYLMQKPSIDRINSNGCYTLENCRYIEFIENLKRRKWNAKTCNKQNKD